MTLHSDFLYNLIGMDLTIANSNLDHLVSGRGIHLSSLRLDVSRLCHKTT
jgi:hypothetical protein